MTNPLNATQDAEAIELVDSAEEKDCREKSGETSASDRNLPSSSEEQSTTKANPIQYNKTTSPQKLQQLLISSACRVLTPTGCTRNFCVSGRMIRPLEPQVGENRPIHVIKREAEAFLREMLAEGIFPSSEAFEQRLKEVIVEIEENKVECMLFEEVNEDGIMERRKLQGVSSNGYLQTKEELEWGVRFAWRNSRKCIMRAHCWDLKCVDLRDIKTSKGMVDAIINHAPAAYNEGRIVPTAFIFPQRRVDRTGPMFWSHQFLNFAGYKLSSGELLGDPAQAQLTKDIIALGWQPPNPQTRWDVLPLVAMAEGDEPAFVTLPSELTQLISIGHPKYPKMADLNLKWVKFPALSRLGFDIGGIQYTASPFIGWFMDAEIGVRNLADTFRYNVLPDVAKVIGWTSSTHTFDELSDHDRLLWLSKAQAELNYAVYCSFQKAGVTCSSSLTASQSWTAFDDQHLREKGYRLNADPYWISPPQGSIVPLWHRGGAPNYQPKPLVARHKCDPVNVWKRRNKALPSATEQVERKTNSKVVGNSLAPHLPKVHIFYCGTSGTAANMAENTRKVMAKNLSRIVGEFGTLNSLDPKEIYSEDTLLLIVATTGKGEIPSNGQKFIKTLEGVEVTLRMRYSIFGIGDSGYHETFNWASKSVQEILDERKLRPLMMDHVIESDVAVENPPWTDFRTWLGRVEKALDGVANDSTEISKEKETSTLFERQYNVLETYKEGTIHFDHRHHQPGKISKMSLKIPELEYEPMGHIRILPRNSEDAVRRVMALLDANDYQTISTISAKGASDFGHTTDEKHSHLRAVPIRRFLTDFVDLHGPFVSMDWAQNLARVNNQSALQVLEELSQSLKNLGSSTPLEKLLLSMTPLRPRSYSIASSSENISDSINGRTNSVLNLLVRVIPNGRFSHQCPADIGDGGKILYKLAPNGLCSSLLRSNGKPLIVVGCGTGIAPIRSLTQYLINTGTDSTLSLFIGFRPDEIMTKLSHEMVQQASEKGILDILHVVPSNKDQVRVQDHFAGCAEALRRKMGEDGGWFYVCGSETVVREVKEKLKAVLGHEIWTTAQERILGETF